MLVIDNVTTSNKIEDICFWYKAEDRPKFKLGSAKFWEYHQRRYNNRYEDSDDEDNLPKKHDIKKIR